MKQQKKMAQEKRKTSGEVNNVETWFDLINLNDNMEEFLEK